MNQSEQNQPTILITGGTGFVGRHLIQALQQKGYRNIHATHFSTLKKELPADERSVQFHAVDLTNRDSVYELFQKIQPTQIYHLASLAVVGNSFEQAHILLENNGILQLNILEAIHRFAPVARLLTIGSAEEYGLVADQDPIDELHPLNPTNPYAVSKVTQDFLANAFSLSFNLNVIRVRPFNHIGEGQSVDFVVPAFASQIVKIEKGQEQTLMVGNLITVRDFTDVKDMVQAYIVLMENGEINQVYNVGSGVGVKISDLLDEMVKLSTAKITIEQDAMRMRPSTAPYLVADAAKITALGWQPKIPLPETLKRILNEWRERI